jgi:hypothetical protein
MPLKLTIRVLNPALSTFDSLKIEVQLESTDTFSWTIPSPDDQTSALTIEVSDTAGKPLRRMNGITSQVMATGGRIDPTPSLHRLGPRETWQWTIDLSSFHYPLPEGEWWVEAVYRYPPEDLLLRSNEVKIRVSAPRLAGLQTVLDNPVLERLDVLFHAEEDRAPQYYVRQYGPGLPLACWFSERVSANGLLSDPFFASSNFMETSTFQAAARRWLLWREGSQLRALPLESGRPAGPARAAVLPEGRSLVRSAIQTREDELLVLMFNPAGDVECWRLQDGRLDRTFSHRPAGSPGARIAVRADAEFLHILVPRGGLVHERLRLSGEFVDRHRLLRTRLKPYSCEFDPANGIAKGVFWDGPHGRSVHLVKAYLRTGDVRDCLLPLIPLRAQIREISFDYDRGRFHLLVSAGRRLYYFRDGSGPWLIAEGEDSFYPLVLAPDSVYLGCYRKPFGYRFLHFRRGRHVPFIVNYEAME